MPKAVINTQRLWCANQQQMTQSMPVLAEDPLVLVDWLPWNHTFGGNHNFGMVIFHGGTLYIDDGKPTPAMISETLRNNRLQDGLSCSFEQYREARELLARCEEGEVIPPDLFDVLAEVIVWAEGVREQLKWEAARADPHRRAEVPADPPRARPAPGAACTWLDAGPARLRQVRCLRRDTLPTCSGAALDNAVGARRALAA
jgi:acyl-CoA synthetase (AMP-forming)/AMP-acid ligase II